MSTNTTNLNLVKPGEDDFYNINIDNANLDNIDTEVAKRVDKTIITAANDFIVGSASGAVVKKTLAETTTGTDITRAVHPAGLKAVIDAQTVGSVIYAYKNLGAMKYEDN